MIIKILDSSKLFSFQTRLSENIYLDQNGYLICEDAILGRSGSQTYLPRELGLKGTEPIEVYRLEEEVFKPESMESLEGRPFTINHPRELVTQENHSRYAKGFVYNVRRDGNNMIGNIQVSDKRAIDLIMKKEMRDLSLGYTNEIVFDESKGIYYFTDIVYNHIALVKKGRAGNAHINDGIEEIKDNEGVEKMELTKEELQELIKQATQEVVKPLETQLNEIKTTTNEKFTQLEAKVEPKIEPQPQVETQTQTKVETTVEPITKQDIENIIKEQLEALKPQAQVETPQEQPQPQVASFAGIGEAPKEVDRDTQLNAFFHSFAKKQGESESEYLNRINSQTINEPLKNIYEREQSQK